MMPVQGGVRKRRNTSPKSDGTIVEYSAQQNNFFTVIPAGYSGEVRRYIPGFSPPLAITVGPEIVSAYSSAKFLPGTKIRWEPSVSFTSTGRVMVGFSDNPEVALQIEGLFGTALGSGLPADWIAYTNAVKGLGSLVSFPVWQETEVNFPTRLRRKMFDTNATIAPTSVDMYDRCLQTCMFIAIEGMTSTANPGNFWFHDKVAVEGLHARIT